MSEKIIELLGIIEIRTVKELETGKDRLLVCLDDSNEGMKQYLFVDELVIGNIKVVVPTY